MLAYPEYVIHGYETPASGFGAGGASMASAAKGAVPMKALG
jgi:hypothetical protein